MNDNKFKYKNVIFLILKCYILFLAFFTAPVFYYCRDLMASFYSWDYSHIFSLFLILFAISITISINIKPDRTVKIIGCIASAIICIAVYITYNENFCSIEISGVRYLLTSSKFAFSAVFAFDIVEFFKIFVKTKKVKRNSIRTSVD